MKKLFVLFGLICVIALAGCGGGGGGSSKASTVSAIEYLEKNYPTVNTSYNSMKSNLKLAIDSRTTEGAVASYVSDLMEVFSDEFLQSGVTKAQLSDKLINKLLDTTNVVTDYSMTPLLNDEHFENETGYIDNNGYLHIITQLSVTKNKLEVTKSFDVVWKNEGTAEVPDWKIISGFPTTGNDF